MLSLKFYFLHSNICHIQPKFKLKISKVINFEHQLT